MSDSLFELGLIVVLVLLNGIFASTEIALVTIRRSRLQQLIDEGNTAALRVQRLKANPGRFLAVIQIGINFLGFLASAFAAVSLVDGMEDWLASFGAGAQLAGALALIIVTGLLTIFTIIFGELVPKQIGLAHAERVAMSTSRLHRGPGHDLRPARRLPDVGDASHQPPVRRGRRGRGAHQLRGAAPHHRTGR